MIYDDSFIVVNFDLRIEECKKVFNGDASKAYYLLKKEFKANGFEHDQGSGYVSTTKLSKTQAMSKVKKVAEKQPWLNQCCTRLRVSQMSNDIFNGEVHGVLLNELEDLTQNEDSAIIKTLPHTPTPLQPEQEKSTCKYTDEEILERIKQRTKRRTKTNDNDGFSM